MGMTHTLGSVGVGFWWVWVWVEVWTPMGTPTQITSHTGGGGWC